MYRILGKASSINVRKVLWICTELGVEYEREDWGSGFASTKTDAFCALNPNGMIPVLIDEDFVLWESNVICRYLTNKHNRTDLLPVELQKRAKVEQWMDWQATELNNSWRYAFMSLVRSSPAHQDPELLAAGIVNWNQHMAILDEQLAQTNGFAVSSTFTLADIVLGLSVNRWVMTPFEKPELPYVATYYDLLSRRVGFTTHGRNGLP